MFKLDSIIYEPYHNGICVLTSKMRQKAKDSAAGIEEQLLHALGRPVGEWGWPWRGFRKKNEGIGFDNER